MPDDETPGSTPPGTTYLFGLTITADGYVSRGSATDDRVYADDEEAS